MVDDYTWIEAVDRQVTKSLGIALEVLGDTKCPVTQDLELTNAIMVMYKVTDPFEKMVAVLHGTNLTKDEMYQRCIPSKVIDAIIAMNLRPDESYRDYLNRIKVLPLPHAVLMATLKVKVENYLANPDGPYSYQFEKVKLALKYLKEPLTIDMN